MRREVQRVLLWGAGLAAVAPMVAVANGLLQDAHGLAGDAGALLLGMGLPFYSFASTTLLTPGWWASSAMLMAALVLRQRAGVAE